jgi:hypothetical protein
MDLIWLQGTVIRVFSIPDGQKLYQLRRGGLGMACMYPISDGLAPMRGFVFLLPQAVCWGAHERFLSADI